MLVMLVIVPLVFAAIVLAIPSNRLRPLLLPVGGAVQLVQVYQQLAAALRAAIRQVAGARSVGQGVSGHRHGAVCHLLGLCARLSLLPLGARTIACSAPACFCRLSMMTLIIISHHLGLMWVAMEATTLATAPGLYFNQNARSLEATWKYLVDLLGGHCAGPVGLAAVGLFVVARQSDARFAVRRAGDAGTAVFDALAAGGVRAVVGRIRHEDGAGADAHLEARRLLRSAGHDRGAVGRRHDQLRVPDDLALLSDHDRGGQSRLRAADAGLHGRLVDDHGVGVDGPAEGFQAHPGLFQRRAHGDFDLWHRRGRSRGVLRPCCMPSTTG